MNIQVTELTEAGGQMLPIGAVAEGQYLRRQGGVLVGASPPVAGVAGVALIRRTVDGDPIATTTFTPDPVLRRALVAFEAVYFEWWVLFTSGVDSDLKLGLLFPDGAAYWYGTHSNVKCAPNETAVRNVVATTIGDYFEVAGHGPTPMVATLVGVVQNGGTPGDMQLRAAQYVAGSGPAIIRANSLLRVWPL